MKFQKFSKNEKKGFWDFVVQSEKLKSWEKFRLLGVINRSAMFLWPRRSDRWDAAQQINLLKSSRALVFRILIDWVWKKFLKSNKVHSLFEIFLTIEFFEFWIYRHVSYNYFVAEGLFHFVWKKWRVALFQELLRLGTCVFKVI